MRARADLERGLARVAHPVVDPSLAQLSGSEGGCG
jgi:hypothetical protein